MARPVSRSKNWRRSVSTNLGLLAGLQGAGAHDGDRSPIVIASVWSWMTYGVSTPRRCLDARHLGAHLHADRGVELRASIGKALGSRTIRRPMGLQIVAGTALLLVLAACGSSLNAVPGSTVLTTTAKQLGTKISFPADKFGIVSVTVTSYTQPEPGDAASFTTPPAGDVFGVIDAQMCAGPGGSAKGPDTTDFTAYTAKGASVLVDLTNDATSPALDNVSSLGANTCAEGSVTFDVPKGVRPPRSPTRPWHDGRSRRLEVALSLSRPEVRQADGAGDLP